MEKLEILVIDDELVVRSVMKRFIGLGSRKDNIRASKDIEYNIDEAENGKIGIELLEEKTYDVVFSDLMMPEMDGMGVIKRLREKSPETPIYIMTGTEKTQKYEQKFEELEMEKPTDIIQKPIDISKIKTIVKDLYDKKYNK